MYSMWMTLNKHRKNTDLDKLKKNRQLKKIQQEKIHYKN